jgi:peroxiredoxin
MKSSLLALAVCLASCATGSASHGKQLPNFTLNSVDGEQVRLSDHLGKDVVVLAFWDTWCEPCKTELPQLDALYKKHHAEGLTLYAVAMDDPSTVSQVAPFVKRSGFSFPVLLDTEVKAANLYNTLKVAPYTVVIDRAGKVHSEKAGYEPGSEKALEDELVKLLAQPAAP